MVRVRVRVERDEASTLTLVAFSVALSRVEEWGAVVQKRGISQTGVCAGFVGAAWLPRV